MNAQTQEKALQKIVIFTQNMLQSAVDENWHDVFQKYDQRQSLIIEFFNGSIIMAEKIVAENINYIMSVDQQLMSIVQKSRDAMLAERKTISVGKSAVAAYAKNL